MDIELASNHVSASSLNSALAADAKFGQTSIRRQTSAAALNTVHLTGNDSSLVPKPGEPAAAGSPESDIEENPELVLGQDPSLVTPRSRNRSNAKWAVEWFTSAVVEKHMPKGRTAALLYLGTVFIVQQPAPDASHLMAIRAVSTSEYGGLELFQV